MHSPFRFALLLGVIVLFFVSPLTVPQEKSTQQTLNGQVSAFLKEHRSSWYDMNIPWQDGQFLHDVIVQHHYTRALEIGTSTGHSAIWIAWALSKTGGRLTTIEIDEERHREALENFKRAGVIEFIDARLGDAHDLVTEIKGPFDFVFSDADKDWNKQYFIDLAPKITVGGCYTTHNISMPHGDFRRNAREYLDYLRSRPDFETSVENDRSTGIALSYKRAK